MLSILYLSWSKYITDWLVIILLIWVINSVFLVRIVFTSFISFSIASVNIWNFWISCCWPVAILSSKLFSSSSFNFLPPVDISVIKLLRLKNILLKGYSLGVFFFKLFNCSRCNFIISCFESFFVSLFGSTGVDARTGDSSNKLVAINICNAEFE